MTKREKHEKIARAFAGGPARLTHFLEVLVRRHGMDLLTDAAVEELASEIVSDHRFHQRLARRNRDLAA